MGERRLFIRQKSFLRGRIHFNNHCSSVDCLIRDIYQRGARTVFAAEAINVPNSVDLHIPQKNQMVSARVLWRRADELGLTFSEAVLVPSQSSRAGDDLAQRVTRLEIEVASLRKALNRLTRATRSGPNAA